MSIRVLSLILVAFILFSCKKKDLNFVIQGNLSDNTFQQGLSGAQVKLYKKSFDSGSESLLTSTTTDGAGYYTLEFPRDEAEYYRIVVSKINYFDINETINFSSLSTEENNERNYSTTAKAWVRLLFVNQAPVNSGDYIKYTKQEGKANCSECCPVNEQTISSSNEEIICVNDGNTNYSYLYTTNGEGPSTGILTINTTAFDTVTLLKEY